MHIADEKQSPLTAGGIVVLLACGIFTPIGLFSPGLILPQMERDFAGVPDVALLTLLVGTLASFSFAIGAPIAGAVIGRIGCRTVMLPALVLFAICGALPAVLADLRPILIARVGLGLALAVIFTGALTGLGTLPAARRMKLFGWFSVVGGVTSSLLFPLIGALGSWGWRPAFLVNLLALALVPALPLLHRSLGIADDDATATATPAAKMPPVNIAMAGVILLAALIGMGILIAPIYSPLYLADQMGITDTWKLAIPVTLGSVLGIFTAASYGRAHKMIGTSGIFILTTVVMGVSLIACGMTRNVTVFTIAMMAYSALVVVAATNVSPAAQATARPGRESRAIGLANGVMFGAQLALPFLGTWLRGLAGLPGMLMTFGGAMLVAGCGVWLSGMLFRPARRRETFRPRA